MACSVQCRQLCGKGDVVMQISRTGRSYRGRMLGILFAAFLVLALHSSASAQSVLRVGVTPGPHEELMEVVQEILAAEGMTIELITFSDYVTPNLALDEGDIDVNSYQHEPFLLQMVRDRDLKLSTLAPTIIFPMGFYSQRISDLAELPDGAQVAIPNDPTNGGRALLLLAHTGLLELAEGVGFEATVFDIVDNPKGLRIVEMDAANLPRSLQDVDLSAINTNFAMEAGLNPVADAIILEDADSPWVNILAVRTADLEREDLAALVRAYHSQHILDFVTERFQASLVPGFSIEE